MVKALSDVDGNILDCKKSIEEFDNAILDLHTEIFNRIQTAFGNLSDEISNLIGLMEDSDVGLSDGSWTKEGLTQLGLYAQQYELAKYQVSQYAGEIEKLNADYLEGKYSATEYADKLADLSSAQWDAVNAAESAKDAIVDLNKARVDIAVDAIQEEIDAYKELTDAQIKALQAEKDLHDYEKSIAEKEKDIAKLRKQIAAMQNDKSAATIAKRKKLEEQLADALADLEETQYQHSIESQEEALNQQYENYEESRNTEIEALEESLKDEEKLISDSLNAVKKNTETISNHIVQIAKDHGVKVSKELTNAWKSGENAIASYGQVLSANTSAFIGQIQSVEAEIYRLQDNANVTAVVLADLFATKADNLVSELQVSYQAEENLYQLTQALRNSLVTTLEGGYDVSSIVNSLRDIEAAARNAKAAIDELNLKYVSPELTTHYSGREYDVTTDDYRQVVVNEDETITIDSDGNKTITVHNPQGNVEDLPPQNNASTDNVILDIKNIPDIKNITGTVLDIYFGDVIDNPLDYALDVLEDNIGFDDIPKHASGTRNAVGGLRIVNEKGYELTLPKLPSGNYAIGNAGDQIFTKTQTDNLFDWSKLKPVDMVPEHVKSLLDKIGGFKLPIPPNGVGFGNNIHCDSMFGSLVTVNGDVNDIDRFANEMEKIADKRIYKTWKEFVDEYKY